jgi:hypothetical protein
MTLQELKLSYYIELKELPTSIRQLMALQELEFSRCSKLKELTTYIYRPIDDFVRVEVVILY